MNYGKKSPSMGTPSIYSHVTTRSSANLRSSRSAKSVKIPWYQKPIITNAIMQDIQRGAMMTAIYSLVRKINDRPRRARRRTILAYPKRMNFVLRLTYELNTRRIPAEVLSSSVLSLFQCLGIFTVCSSIFDIYCLSQAIPGSTHYGYYVISYEFVYVGNQHGKCIDRT